MLPILQPMYANLKKRKIDSSPASPLSVSHIKLRHNFRKCGLLLTTALSQDISTDS